jgi:hypothetical protein
MKFWRKQEPPEQCVYAWLEGIEAVRVRIPEGSTPEQFFKQISTLPPETWWLTGDSIWRRGPTDLRFRVSQAVFWLDKR